MKEAQSSSSQESSSQQPYNQNEHATFHSFKQIKKISAKKLEANDDFREGVPLSIEDIRELRKANDISYQRQQLRIVKINASNNIEIYHGTAGRARFIIGLSLFFAILLLCAISGLPENTNKTLILELSTLRHIVFALCIIGALLIFTSGKRHRIMRYSFTILAFILAWAAPKLWNLHQLNHSAQIAKEAQINHDDLVETKKIERQHILQEKNLTEYTEYCNNHIAEKNLAFFIMGSQMSQRRDIIDIIHRYTKAKTTNAYTKKNGLLIICGSVTLNGKNERDIAALFGDIIAEKRSKGIYGISYNNDIAHLKNSYPNNCLSDSTHISYVNANLEELQSKVSNRVRRAANLLMRKNFKNSRQEIFKITHRALQEPWENEYQTRIALITTLINYAEPLDVRAIDIAYKYITSDDFRKNEQSSRIIKYLIDNIPTKVTQTIVDKWLTNPLAWNNQLMILGLHAQDALTLKLDYIIQTNPNNIQLINNILYYLNNAGTAKAIPNILPYKQHNDALIRNNAKSCINSIKAREQEKLNMPSKSE